MPDRLSTSAADRRFIGWYVHLPFCTTKCGYCDFYSLPTIAHLVTPLVEAISREMTARDPRRPVEAIFIGGGTPTVLPTEALEAVLVAVNRHTGLVAEFTVEANPSSTDELKLDLLRGRGVNRISFGAQSFDKRELAVLERIHDPEHVGASVRAARAAGFDNVNLDLIFGVPGQTMGSLRESLHRALELETEHLSCYSLMYELGTSLTRLRNEGRLTPCDEELEAEMFEFVIETLTAAGYEHYEISNFARPGRRCRANVIYWENREYLGIGPSAVSYLDGVRRKNVADVRRYVETLVHQPPVEDPPRRARPGDRDRQRPAPPGENVQSPCDALVAESEQLDPLHRAHETAVQMLRLTDGIDYARFAELTGFDGRTLFADRVSALGGMGLLTDDARGIRLTRRGLLVSNRIMQEFLPKPAPAGVPL